jgi:hypothetical protein
MSPLLTDLAQHAGQLSLSVLFMLFLALVLYGEPDISQRASAFVTSLLSGPWR